MTKTQKKRGPKKIQINWKQVEAACQIQCTQEEIAALIDCSVDTIERRCEEDHGIKFAEYFAQKKEGGRASLRRKQWLLASNNPAMAIFLGKNYLGQSDQQKIKFYNGDLENYTDAQLEDELKKLMGKEALK